MSKNTKLARFKSFCDKYNIKLVAVSKTKPIPQIMELYNEGQLCFGENRVQELVEKYEQMPKDIEWHLIGHLQTNKVKYVAPFVEMIHAVDSQKLLNEIDKQAAKNNRKINVLLQMHIAQESTKFGMIKEELFEILKLHFEESKWQNVQICGLMAMATFTQNKAIVNAEFEKLKTTFELAKTNFELPAHFKELSMGMSGDYEIAAEKGSTMIRIGSALFGSR